MLQPGSKPTWEGRVTYRFDAEGMSRTGRAVTSRSIAPPPPACVILIVDLPGGPRFMVSTMPPSGTGAARLRGVWWDAGAGWEALEGGLRQLQTLLLTGSGRATADSTRPSAAGASLSEPLWELLLAEADMLAGYEIAHLEEPRVEGLGIAAR